MKNKYDNSGALFTNDKKLKDTHPHMNGKITILGREFYLSAWKKQSKEGKPFLSLSIKPVDEVQQVPQVPTPSVLDDFLNDF